MWKSQSKIFKVSATWVEKKEETARNEITLARANKILRHQDSKVPKGTIPMIHSQENP